MQAKLIIERHGFRKLGEITAESGGRLLFPKTPNCGGLYFIVFQSGGYYVGETGKYAGNGTAAGRFNDYMNPADDIWTELVINSMLLTGGGGIIYIWEQLSGGRTLRVQMEKAVIRDFLFCGVPLWNDGGGRCENAYLSWKIPIIEHMLASAAARYATREVLKPYAVERLRRLPLELAKARAQALKLGVAAGPQAPTASSTKNSAVAVPPQPADGLLSRVRRA